ncbi:MAG: MFS transporter, partial [Alphaproteobacteria bacterium]|nr:MFS transporter [Alphaproteobacteria bacterium]
MNTPLETLSGLKEHKRLISGIKPYIEAGPLAAFFLGISSALVYTMLAATMTQRLSEAGVNRKSISAFALALLIYSFKPLWAPFIDRYNIPLFTRAIGHRRSWLVVIGAATALALVNLALPDPKHAIGTLAIAAIIAGFCGASYDIVIDAYRIEMLKPHQLGASAGMSQYGWRFGATTASSLALIVATRANWGWAYIASALLVLPAILTSLVLGEPQHRKPTAPTTGFIQFFQNFLSPFGEFLRRDGGAVVLAFVLVSRIGDTMSNLMVRDLFHTLGYTKPEILYGDVWFGLGALFVGIFAGGVLYARLGLKHAVLVSLILMPCVNFGFGILSLIGHNMSAMIAVNSFENFGAGVSGVVMVAYLSALCNLEFTASQFALLSAAAAILGRFLTAGTAGALIEALGYFNFYILTAALSLPGIFIYLGMLRSGLV